GSTHHGRPAKPFILPPKKKTIKLKSYAHGPIIVETRPQSQEDGRQKSVAVRSIWCAAALRHCNSGRGLRLADVCFSWVTTVGDDARVGLFDESVGFARASRRASRGSVAVASRHVSLLACPLASSLIRA